MRIFGIQKITNDEVLGRMKKEAELIILIKIHVLQYLRLIMANEHKYELPQRILQDKINGKRKRGRRRISRLANLRA